MRSVAAGVILGLLAAGCGGSETTTSTSTGTGSSTPQTPAGTPTPEQALAQGLEQMMKAGGAGSAKALEFGQLTALMVDIPGWEKSDVSGEQGAMMNMTYARAEGRYAKGDTSIHVEIVDTAMIQAMVMPFQMAAAGGFDQKSSEGYKRGTTVAGNPGWEEWQIQDKNGDVNVLVGSRFVVKGSGNGLPSIDVVKEVIQALPLAKLAALK